MPAECTPPAMQFARLVGRTAMADIWLPLTETSSMTRRTISARPRGVRLAFLWTFIRGLSRFVDRLSSLISFQDPVPDEQPVERSHLGD